MKSLYFFIAITIFLHSCVSENEQVALNQIKELYETEDIIASYGFDYDTNGKNVNYIEINIKGSPVINSEGYNPELAASTSALSWYNSLNEEQLKDYNTIIVNIESNIKTNKFEYSFDHISNINSSSRRLTAK